MKKGQLPIFAELTLGTNTQDSTSKIAGKFTGTTNPRHLRVLYSLEIRSRTREEIDRIAGASNGPDLMGALRRRGLEIPCPRIPAIDRDGRKVTHGVYSLTDDDRRKLKLWSKKSKGVTNEGN
jgi:hypothetical protein